MSTVKEIQSAIESLSPAENRELLDWLEARRERSWDAQLAADSQPGGRMEDLLREIDADIDAGKVTAFPK
jgi:hypothetical protein